MDISFLRSEFTMALYNNTVPYLLCIMERVEYLIDSLTYLLEIIVTLLLTSILGLTICLKWGMFHFWDAFMDFTKRKNKLSDGIRYNLLFYNTDSAIGNIFIFNKIKSSSQMELIKNVNHMTCVLSGSFREYYLIEGLNTDTKWMCIRRNPGHFKHENNDQHYRIELSENINDDEPWILSLQIKHINWLPFFNYSSSEQSEGKVNCFELDENYHADSEDNDNYLETIDEEEHDDEILQEVVEDISQNELEKKEENCKKEPVIIEKELQIIEEEKEEEIREE